MIERSARAITAVVSVSELLSVLLSVVVEVTVAVFDKTVPSAVLAATVPVTVMVALLPAVIVPRLQGKAAQPPCEELTVTPVSCAGQRVIDGNSLGIGRSGIADRDVVSE